MRSNEEFKAEVFRRSDMYVKKRKKRNMKILFSVLPVVLCVSLVFSVPRFFFQKSEEPISDGNNYFGAMSSTPSMLIIVNGQKDDENSLKVVSEEDRAVLNKMLEEITLRPENSFEGSDASKGESETEAESVKEETFSFTIFEGDEKKEIFVAESYVYFVEESTKIQISEEEKEKLVEVIKHYL